MRWLPRSLFSRMVLVLLGGLVVAQLASLAIYWQERGWLMMHTTGMRSAEGVVVALSGSEYKLLRIFLAHANRVLNRDQLIDLMLSRDASPFDRSIDVQVSRLRHRLGEGAKEPAIIKTVRGEGYVLSVPVEVGK